MAKVTARIGTETNVFFSRTFAAILDGVIAVVVAGFFEAAVAGVGSAFTGLGALVGLVVIFGYFIYFEATSGQTIGKRAFGIVVVDADGNPIGYRAATIRNLLRVVDFFPAFYLVGVLAMVGTRRSQRIGDVGAETVVAKAVRTDAETETDARTSA